MPIAVHDVLRERYRIDYKIGEGAFGEVYRAYDLSLDRAVAIKALEYDGDRIGSQAFNDFAKRFQREKRVQARYNHPNIVQIFDIVELPKQRAGYLVMEYVHGQSLQQFIEDNAPVAINKAIVIMQQILAALQVVHDDARQVVHRDVKPSNILLTEVGSPLVKLTDFGLAQVADESRREQGGQPHPGSQLYMSPEQEETTAYLYPESDIYSAGCILFEMITGYVYKRALRERDEIESYFNSSCPRVLVNAILKAVSLSENDRFETAREFANEISMQSLKKDEWLDLAERHLINKRWDQVISLSGKLQAFDEGDRIAESLHRHASKNLALDLDTIKVEASGLAPQEVRESRISRYVTEDEKLFQHTRHGGLLSVNSNDIFIQAWHLARSLSQSHVYTGHLLYVILERHGNVVPNICIGLLTKS